MLKVWQQRTVLDRDENTEQIDVPHAQMEPDMAEVPQRLKSANGLSDKFD